MLRGVRAMAVKIVHKIPGILVFSHRVNTIRGVVWYVRMYVCTHDSIKRDWHRPRRGWVTFGAFLQCLAVTRASDPPVAMPCLAFRAFLLSDMNLQWND